MDHKLKQRLTGAIVLVALAVIFVPIILEGPDDDWTPRSHSIPEQPQMDYRASMELELPGPEPAAEPSSGSVITEALKLQETAPAVDQSPQVEQQPPPAAEKAPVAVATPPKPARAAPPPPPPKAEKAAQPPLKGWFVQVGSFGQEMNASGLRERLKSAGYDARLHKVSIGKGYAYRVLVGPASTRAGAEKTAARLKSGQQLAGMVIEYP
jgi:DedD protein